MAPLPFILDIAQPENSRMDYRQEDSKIKNVLWAVDVEASPKSSALVMALMVIFEPVSTIAGKQFVPYTQSLKC